MFASCRRPQGKTYHHFVSLSTVRDELSPFSYFNRQRKTRHELQHRGFHPICCRHIVPCQSSNILLINQHHHQVRSLANGRKGSRRRRRQRREYPTFQNLDLDIRFKQALEKAGWQRMTAVQAETWEPAVQGRDILARARTGTGKTVAFLLPSLERILRDPKSSPSSQKNIEILVLSPNRELALQTAEQANLLLRSHDKSLSCMAVVGGTNAKQEVQQMKRYGVPTILVATPGRLLSHLQGSVMGDRPFSACMNNLRVLIIDEADKMLDLGFQESLQEILTYCPPTEKRQTMLFSATFDCAKSLAAQSTKPEYVLVDCISDESSDPLNEKFTKVKQSYVMVPPERIFSTPIEILVELTNMDKKRPCKVMAFFPTINQVRLYEGLFNYRLGRRVFAIHSEMEQSARSSVRKLFQYAKNGILLTTDASARGVDYSDITHVVQFGIPYDENTYIHRLGRTARAGKSGEGLLVLMPLEAKFLQSSLGGTEINHDTAMQSILNSRMEAFLDDQLSHVLAAVRDGSDPELKRFVREASDSMHAYYRSRAASLDVLPEGAGIDLEDSILEITSKFMHQAGVSSRPRVDMAFNQKAWSPGDGFDVGSSISSKRAK